MSLKQDTGPPAALRPSRRLICLSHRRWRRHIAAVTAEFNIRSSVQIRELVPESQAYMDLLAFERKLDQTIMRKRVDIQEALKRPMKVRAVPLSVPASPQHPPIIFLYWPNQIRRITCNMIFNICLLELCYFMCPCVSSKSVNWDFTYPTPSTLPDLTLMTQTAALHHGSCE